MLASLMRKHLEKQYFETGQGVQFNEINLREHTHAIMDSLTVGFPSGELASKIHKLEESDGLIAVTPIFLASMSGLFKTFFDTLGQDALKSKPTLLGATAGTSRHTLALEHSVKPMFSYLKASVTPTSVFAATEEWGQSTHIEERASTASKELIALIKNYDKRDDSKPLSFQELLSLKQNP